jgi:plasmid stability protein
MQTSTAQPARSVGDRFILRFNVDGLRKELKVRAATNERSLNAEILYLIKRGLAAEQAQGVAA